ncbi:MAG: DUF2846 domain-containing protein [Gammaproteobacteria bacterium]
MYKKLCAIAISSSLFAGCASVPLESIEKSNAAKQFSAPAEGTAGLYIYRSGSVGGALKMDVWVDDDCVGETAPNVFFYEAVQADKKHKISTESEFSSNDISLKTENGKNYFIQQFIKMGVFVGGAGVRVVDEEEGKKKVQKLKLAKSGTCSK